MNELNDLIKFLGSVILSLTLMSFPILATLSWVLDWNFLVRLVLSIIVFGYFVYFTAYFYYMKDGGL